MLAKITFRGPQRGGRNTPPQTGVRPTVRLGDEFTSCKIESTEGVEVFEFDREYNVRLTLFFPDKYQSRLHTCDDLNFYEGAKQVANGKIVSE
jgi:hypothetical protein